MKKDNLQIQFVEMLNLCEGTILKLCLRYTNRQQGCFDDLYQDIVENLWNAYRHFEGRSNPNTWVYSIALKTAKKNIRSHLRMPPIITTDLALYENLPESDDDERKATLLQLIEQLDAEEKDLTELYLDGVPQSEIARLYHTTEEAINHRIHNIKTKLKKLYEDEQ